MSRVPPRSPLPPRHGLAAAWVRTPDRVVDDRWHTMTSWLRERIGTHVDVDGFVESRRFVYGDGTAVRSVDAYRPHTFVWFHRDLRDEPDVPGELTVLHRDERLVVVDKPAFLSTIPRGRHVLQSVVVRLRDELGLPELTPAHRLDRVTSGVVVLTTRRQWRALYQGLFERQEVRKTYRALAPWLPGLDEPVVVRDHVRPVPGAPHAEVVPGAPVNAETLVELEERRARLAVYRLTPRTGRTHQLRLHLLGLGAPIVDDPLYPVRIAGDAVDVDDFTRPLQLLASEIAFLDPVDGTARHFGSARALPLVTPR